MVCLGLLLAGLCLSGCAGLYFRDVQSEPAPVPRATLAHWPYQEYWTGIVFNGEKIGFTHLVILPPPQANGEYELRSEAVLAFRFLGFGKRFSLQSRDWVSDDLHLVRFDHTYDLDGRRLRLTGRVRGSSLEVERTTGQETHRVTRPLPAPLYPLSALVLYPRAHGLAVGRTHEYLAYDGQREDLMAVTQVVDAFQESELYEGQAYRIATTAGGQASTLWLNPRGEPVLEMAWNGILISGLESERRAKADLAEASVNKRETLLEYSRIRTPTLISHPRTVTELDIAVTGLPDGFIPPSDTLQRCRLEAGETRCVIRAMDLSHWTSRGNNPPGDTVPADLAAFTTPSAVVESHDPAIQRLAMDIVDTSGDRLHQIHRLIEWIQHNLDQEPSDAFSATQVLAGRKGECQGLTWVYTAFARSLGIPTRVTNGLVYSDDLEGFLYHTWAESYVGDVWLPVDATFAQVGVDATHVKLLDGERPVDLLPLVDLVGRIRVTVHSVSPS